MLHQDQLAQEFAEELASLIASSKLLSVVPENWKTPDGRVRGIGLEVCVVGEVAVAIATISEKTVNAANQLAILMEGDTGHEKTALPDGGSTD